MTPEDTTEIKQEAEQPSETSATVFLEDEEDFATLYEESVRPFREHEIVNGTVIRLNKDFVVVDIGYKSEGQIDINEFQDENHQVNVSEGDEVEVFLDALEDSEGTVVLSRDKAIKLRIWEEVGRVFDENGTLEGVISSRIKGGLSVDIGVKAFLPGSQVDLRPVRNLDKLIGERFEFKILKFNQKRGNIVLSRRALLEVDREERRKKTLAVLEEGARIIGYVKNITEYGVFIDLGGVDGLLHITDMTWGRIVHPSEMFNIGDEVEVIVLKFDRVEEKVSLGLKQKSANPWDSVVSNYPVGSRVQGKIVSLTDYGAFIEIEPGVEGLIHVSEMSWTRRVRHPSKILSLEQEVEVVVKDLDVDRKRISLSIKEAEPNPWDTIQDLHPVGTIITGKVRNITDFGIFVGLDEGIDGLVHISDLSWSQRQRKPSAFAKKGDEISAKILHINPEKERLSLGIKQLTEDPWKDLAEKIQLDEEVTGRVVNVTEFGIFAEVLDGVEGLVHVSEIDNSIPKDKLEEFYQVGSLIKARVLKIDVDERRLGLGLLQLLEGPPESEEDTAVLRQALADVEEGDGEATDATPAADAAEPPADNEATQAEPASAPQEPAEAAEPPADEEATQAAAPVEPSAEEPVAEDSPPESEAANAPESEAASATDPDSEAKEGSAEEAGSKEAPTATE
ncbi:MAG: 30S ribosomal protein S1 [SAR324 cluster bacterium]|nr:30S ribosomal protein S1 [SAR324 cluster bacterium]